MHMIQEKSGQTKASFPIAVVTSRFNEAITQALQEGALSQLKARGIRDEDITCIEVPGAVEIPLVAQVLAEKKHYQVIITLGAVIRGETSHYDYVCQMVSHGCQQVALKHQIPVIFGVLTTENEAQAWDRLGGAMGHKGKEVADCALAMQNILGQLS